jgi:hypothetical protein
MTAAELAALATDCERRMVRLIEATTGQALGVVEQSWLTAAAQYATVAETLRRMERESKP